MQSRAITLYKGEFKHPNYIYVSNKLGQEATAVSTEVFAKKLGVTWCDTNMIMQNDVAKMPDTSDHYDLDSSAAETLFELFEKSSNKLAITYMNDKVGYGVFAREDIPSGTYIAQYTGLIRPISDEMPIEKHSNAYGIGVCAESGKYLCTVNAEFHRNIGAFFQHVPENKSDYMLTKNVVEMATQNLQMIGGMSYKGYPLAYFKANRLIHKGEMLGWDYGVDYWMNHQKVPELFTVKGDVIPPSLYVANKLTVRLHIDDKSTSIKISRADFKEIFATDHTFKIQVEPHEILVITEEDFFAELNKNVSAPYVEIPRPSYIIPVDGTEDEQSQCEQEAAKEDNNTEKLPSTFGLYSATKSTAICAELERVSAPLKLRGQWQYLESQNLACIAVQANDKHILKTFSDYLVSQTVHNQYIFDEEKQLAILVVDSNLAQLKKLDVISQRIEAKPLGEMKCSQ